MPREFSARNRKPDHYRDSSLIVIATEGTKTEKQYFSGLKTYNDNGKTSRIHIEILSTEETGHSSPKWVVDRLRQFKRDYKIHPGQDELWLVCDLDKWGPQLAEVARDCLQMQFKLAVSNPSFEIWLLFHYRSLQDYSLEILDEFRQNRRISANRTRIDQELLTIIGHYNKANLDLDSFIPHVDTANRNAREAEVNETDRWPQDLGSRVYLLVEKIISFY